MISGNSRKVQLRGGGSLSVRLEDLSWTALGEDERVLVSAIADAMHTYEFRQRSKGEPMEQDRKEQDATGGETTKEETKPAEQKPSDQGDGAGAADPPAEEEKTDLAHHTV